MRKRIFLPLAGLIIFVVVVATAFYVDSLVSKTVKKLESYLSKRSSMNVDVDAQVNFFPPQISVNEIVFKKGDRSVVKINSCVVGDFFNIVFKDQHEIEIICANSQIDLKSALGFLRSFNKRESSEKSNSSEKMSVSVSLKIDNMLLNYDNIQETLSLDLRFKGKEGVLRVKSINKIKSNGFIEVLFSIPKRKADVRFESIELVNFSKLLSEMTPIELLEGKMSGILKLSLKTGAIFSESDVIISDFATIHPVVDTAKFSIPFLRFVGIIEYDIGSKDLTVEESRISLGGVAGTLSGKYSEDSRLFDIDLNKIELNKLETVVRNESFKGYLFDGYIDMEIKYRQNTELGESFSLIGNVIDPSQLSSRLNYLSKPFKYSFTDQFDKKRTFVVGPSNVDFTDLGSIPKHLQWAVLVSEDAGFYVHQGVDFKEIDAAVRDNMKKKKFRGGSTITQQLAKNLFLKREKTMMRKFREAILAVEIDATLSKRRQLEIYLNIIEWGPGIFGISEASWYYFGKTPAELTPLESAYLASIIPGPYKYNYQFKKKLVSEKWMKRLHNILGLMNETGHLDLGDYYDAQSEDLIFRDN